MSRITFVITMTFIPGLVLV